MRLIHYILLTLLATAAAAQDFNFYPSSDEPKGGAEIHILATSSSGSLRFTAPQVFFGDVPSPRVTLLNAYQVIAVAPAHAIGYVSVTVRDNGALLKSSSRFVFEPKVEEILIPIAYAPISANYGTRWVSDVSVYNESDDAVAIDREVCFVALIELWTDCSQGARRVAPHASMRIEQEFASADYPWMLLHPPADHAARLHFTVRLRETSRDPAGPGTEIPVVRSRDFQQAKVWLSSIPTSSRFRSTLRVYTRWYSVTVRVKDNATGELLKEWTIPRSFPTDSDSFGTVTIPGLLDAAEVRSHERVRIEVETAEGVPVWALLTLTDNESQRVQIFTPQ